jgi:hypothetical protein
VVDDLDHAADPHPPAAVQVEPPPPHERPAFRVVGPVGGTEDRPRSAEAVAAVVGGLDGEEGGGDCPPG